MVGTPECEMPQSYNHIPLMIYGKDIKPGVYDGFGAVSYTHLDVYKRQVHIASRQEVFHFGPTKGTNNIGEFLAIVHGLALLKQLSLIHI